MQTHIEVSKRFASQLPVNIVANMVYFIVSIIVGIVLVPYFVSTLGVAAYGIIPLATSITGYVAIVVQSLNMSVSRHLTVYLQQENYAAANRTFNTAIFGLSTIIALMVPVVIVVAVLMPILFHVPAGQENDVTLLFLGVCSAFLINAWSGNFTVQLFAYNRLDFQNLVNITNIIVQTGLIVLFFELYHPSLAVVGLAYLIAAISASIVAITLAKRVCPFLKLSISAFDRSRLKDLGGMGGWAIVNQIGSLLFLQIDLIVVNILFGSGIAGEYAIVLMWGMLMRSVASTISGVFTPMVLTYYAKGQIETLTKMMISAVKLMGLIIALPIGLICGFAPQILTVWVGAKYAFLAPLLMLMVIHLTINLSVTPLFSINIAYNKIRVPGILTFFMGLGNFGLAFALPLFAGMGFYGVAAAGAIVLTLKNAVFTPWYATKVMGIKPFTFTKSMLPGIIAAISLMIGSTIIGHFTSPTSLITLAFVGGIISIAYLSLIGMFGLSTSERMLFKSYIPESFRRLVL